MQTRSSVLGKRSLQLDTSLSTSPSSTLSSSIDCINSLPTPEQTPKAKRARVSPVVDGDANKENVKPLDTISVNRSSPVLQRASALTRSSTEIITPSRPRTTRRHASASNINGIPSTPTTTLAHLALSTPPPSPPLSLLPVYARARALLRSTCTDSSMAGRVNERETITTFLRNFEDTTADRCLYISGTPGTGKTALVYSVIRSLDISEVAVALINCMGLGKLDALWDRLSDELSGSRCQSRRKLKGKQAVEAAISTLSRPCVILLDELDHVSDTNGALEAIFSLPRDLPMLRIIGIANTHTLTSGPEHKISGVQTLHFPAYSSPELLSILKARLSPLHDFALDCASSTQAQKLLPESTLTLLSKKIASQTGDVRALFEVLRGAIDLAVSASKARSAENPLDTPTPTVTPPHILSALKAYLPAAPARSAPRTTTASASVAVASETVTKVQDLGLQARFVLLSILLASQRCDASLPLGSSPAATPRSPVKRTASSSAVQSGRASGHDLTHLYTYYSKILSQSDDSGHQTVSRSEFNDLVGVLETVGLVVVSSCATMKMGSPSKSGRKGFGRSASFGADKAVAQRVQLVETLRQEEVMRGLGVHNASEGPRNVTQEEIQSIWIRENSRLKKDMKAHVVQADSASNPFEDAWEC